MTTEYPVELFKAYLWLFWCVVKGPSTQDETLTRAWAGVCANLDFDVGVYPTNADTTLAAGYCPMLGAAWVRPASADTEEAVNAAVKGFDPGRLFYDDGLFHRRVTEITDAKAARLVALQAGRLDIRTILKTDRFQVLTAILDKQRVRYVGDKVLTGRAIEGERQPGHGLPLPLGKYLVTGYDKKAEPGVVWLGLRGEPFPERLSAAQRAHRVRHPDGFTQRFPAPDGATEASHAVRKWWPYTVRGFQRAVLAAKPVGKMLFEDLFRLIGTRPIFANAGFLRHPPERQPPHFRLADISATAGEFRTGLIAALPHPDCDGFLRREGERILLVCSNRSQDELEDALYEFLPTQLPPGLAVVVFPVERFAEYLSRCPDLWTQYFSASCGFVLLAPDVRHRLFEFLVSRSPDLYKLLSAGDASVHPALAPIVLAKDAATRFVIVGRPGGGKSTALFHFITRQLSDRHAILLGKVHPPQWRWLSDLLRDYAGAIPAPIIAVDEIDNECRPLLGRLRLFLQRDAPKTMAEHISVLFTAQRAEWHALKKETESFAHALGFTDPVVLDPPPFEWLTGLATRYFAHYSGSTTFIGDWHQTLNAAVTNDYTPAAVREFAVTNQLGPATVFRVPSVASDQRRHAWAKAFRALSPSDQTAARLICILRFCCFQQIVVSDFELGLKALAVDADEGRLEEDGWSWRNGTTITWDGLPYDGVLMGVVSDAFRLTRQTKDLLRRLVQKGYLSDDTRRRLHSSAACLVLADLLREHWRPAIQKVHGRMESNRAIDDAHLLTIVAPKAFATQQMSLDTVVALGNTLDPIATVLMTSIEDTADDAAIFKLIRDLQRNQRIHPQTVARFAALWKNWTTSPRATKVLRQMHGKQKHPKNKHVQ
jgi:hypothetical protein